MALSAQGSPSRGLSLVELLVVIGIIVILLAILVPVISSVMYHAELAQCGGNLKVIAAGATAYAGSYKRFYPDPGAVNGARVEQAFLIRGAGGSFDRRPAMSHAFNLFPTLGCPLSPIARWPVPNDHLGEPPAEVPGWSQPRPFAAKPKIGVSYSLWFGFGFKGEPVMSKLGDVIVVEGNRLEVIAGDIDVGDLDGDTRLELCTHPDHAGKMLEDGVFWKLRRPAQTDPRGQVDLNHAYIDGSVHRYADVMPVSDSPGHDPRMVNIPFYYDYPDHSWRRQQVPNN